MKKIYLSIISGLVCLVIYGQETLQSVTDNGNTTTNKIGIKNSSPDYYLDHKITNNILGIEKVFRISTYGGTNFARRYSMEVLGNGANANDFYQIFGGALHSNSSIGNPVFTTYGNWSGFAWEWRGSSSDNLTLYGIESSASGSPASVQNTIINFNAVNGNVGIGTTTPGKKLEVKGDDGVGIRIFNQSANTWDILNSQYGKLDFVRGGSNIYMRIDQFGNVGIGTTNTFGYKLAVNGTIGSTEVKVENTSAWPDFVFEKDYELLTLEEVEEHINENGHLPKIPSEQEVAESGINLGEMDAKLLQKIEELTLYMIDVNKRVNELENENKELKEKLSQLESK